MKIKLKKIGSYSHGNSPLLFGYFIGWIDQFREYSQIFARFNLNTLTEFVHT